MAMNLFGHMPEASQREKASQRMNSAAGLNQMNLFNFLFQVFLLVKISY